MIMLMMNWCWLIITFIFIIITQSNQLEIEIIHQLINTASISPLTLLNNDNDTYANISYGYKLPMINLCFGTPKQCSIYVLDTFSTFSWINSIESQSSHPYNKNHSSTFEKQGHSILSIDYDNFDILGTPSSEKPFIPPSTSFPSENLTFINVFFFSYLNSSFDGQIALPRKAPIDAVIDKKKVYQLSLIDILYRENIIDARLFSIRYISKDKGILHLGILSPYIRIDDIYKIYHSDNTQRDIDRKYLQPYWIVIVDGLSFGKYNKAPTSNGKYAVISTGQTKIQFPYSMTDVNDYIIYETRKIAAPNCDRIKHNNWEFVLCEPFDVMKMPKVSIHLANYTLSVKPEDLFVWSERYTGKLECVLQRTMIKDYWVIGDPALRNEYMVFDMDNEYVGFYNGTIPIEAANGMWDGYQQSHLASLFKIGYISICSVLIVMIIVLSFIKRIALPDMNTKLDNTQNQYDKGISLNQRLK